MRTGLTMFFDSSEAAQIKARYFGREVTYSPFVVLSVEDGETSLAMHFDKDESGARALRQLADHAAALADRIDGGRPRVLVEEVGKE